MKGGKLKDNNQKRHYKNETGKYSITLEELLQELKDYKNRKSPCLTGVYKELLKYGCILLIYAYYII